MMSNTYSKIELLYLINQLKEHGDLVSFERLQKILLDSLSEDKDSGKFNIQIELDRKEKKAVAGAKIALKNEALHEG